MSDGELITDAAGLQQLAREWDALAVAASNPVAAPAWILAWLRHVADPGLQPRVVAVRDRGALVGLAPFYAAPDHRGVVWYRLMAGDFGVCMEPLALPGREWDVATVVCRVLASCHPHPDIIEFGPMALASLWTTALACSWPARMRALVRRYRLDGAPVIVLRDPSFEAWLASLSPKMRRSLRQSERLFQEAGGSTRWSTAETLRADAEAFARLHGDRWEERGSRLTDLGSALPDWLEDLARGALEEGRVRMCVLELGGSPICVDFYLTAGEELATINSAWDESHAKLSPARLAVLRVVGDACERGCRRVHLGLGNYANKLRLANGNDPVAWTMVMPPSRRLPYTYARVLPGLLRKRARDAAERALPEERFEAARSTSRRLRALR
ncbi:MAG TPA: GNAT family N-acetyltransferase [Solirubrobacteraceae bacterium]|nr:GNAT family N-acetyltransferase [Solirubrobacteraceae bacterium]